MNWDLPVSVELGGAVYPIRSDYRVALDICMALNDPDLNGQEKTQVVLTAFYPVEIPPECWQEAIEKCFWFIEGGDGLDQPQKSPRLVDWEQDFRYIVAPVNRIAGGDIRAMEYRHWWTFLADYQEIGDCTFAQVVRIRDHLARGKPLDKMDREWYRKNRQLVDFRRKYTRVEKGLLKEWGGV